MLISSLKIDHYYTSLAPSPIASVVALVFLKLNPKGKMCTSISYYDENFFIST